MAIQSDSISTTGNIPKNSAAINGADTNPNTRLSRHAVSVNLGCNKPETMPLIPRMRP